MPLKRKNKKRVVPKTKLKSKPRLKHARPRAVKTGKHRPKNGWRTVAIFFIAIFFLQIFFTYSFTGKRIFLGLGERLGLSEQQHDTEGRDIFEVNGVTYVAYKHPLVVAKIVVDPSCTTEMCDVNSLKRQILTNLTPAIQFAEVDFESGEGKRLIAEANIKAVPAFVFDENIKLLANFEFIKEFFVEYERYYLLKTPPGRFIATPHKEAAHVKGVAENANITITEFSSFSCESCRDMSLGLRAILEKYPNDVTLRFIHFNRGGHDNDLIQAAECSAEQWKFWQMHDTLFARQKDFTNKYGDFNFGLLSEIAQEIGLDTDQFAQCMADTGRFAVKLQNMQRVSADFGIKAAPSIFINNSFTEGFITKDQLSEKIEKALNPPAENVAQTE